MRHFVNKKVNAGHIYQVRAADAIPNINFSLPNGYIIIRCLWKKNTITITMYGYLSCPEVIFSCTLLYNLTNTGVVVV